MAERLDPNTQIETPPEAIIFAKILQYGSMFGIGLMIITFLIYIFGILPSFVPPEKLPKIWHLTAHEFVKHIGLKTGWNWIHYINYGDILNYIGIAFLAGLVIIGYVAILPFLFSSGAYAVGIISVLEIAILILAASGILQAGH
ncbi:hypothetical protein Thein_0329 [Thermodesulfatator indicus DSM 15286]|uniref:DUF1634 domain-containing protein n=1 Tax=Thermodesulfatator indicus (strain DSM 15286 / JCM 11887 / CIR29812) TaxID=667014 RepID=F8AA76_THEID|nr:hypothetical protein [Thermodesulfatator indicus]AEH44212.1 hypothetical protein Thein_0329 [Thermodesulfatator indicus DSM 15286]